MTADQFFKNLSDETRLNIALLIFAEQELCVCELTNSLNLSQPKISRHIAQLRDTGLLVQRRQGKWIYYRLSDSLPSWQVSTIEGVYKESQQTLLPLQERLKAMGEASSERIEKCCQ